MAHRSPGMRWKSKFARFVDSFGTERLAKKLGVEPSAIYHWIRATTRPIPERAEIIQRIALKRGVRLTLEDIYGHSRDLRARDRSIAAAIHESKVRAASR